jgi:nucleoid-associated protein YgaU
MRRRLRSSAFAAVAALSVAAAAPGVFHDVRRGDTLATIAAETLGDPTLWPALYRAEREKLLRLVGHAGINQQINACAMH